MCVYMYIIHIFYKKTNISFSFFQRIIIVLLLLLLLSLTHVLFLGQIFEIEILMELHIMRSPEFENHIFIVWSVCMYVCCQHISKTNNSRNIKFGILYLYHI